MASASSRVLFSWLAALVLAGIDQATKAWAASSIALWHGHIEVIPGFFNLVYYQNRGAAFSFLNSTETDWQLNMFRVVSVIAVLVLTWLIATAHRAPRTAIIGYGLVLSGALGNLVDRIRLGYVIDFLDVYVGSWHWPAFNVADSAICVGVALLFVMNVIEMKKGKNGSNE